MTNQKQILGALYDFLGFLTTRPESVTLGARENVTEALDLLEVWAKKRGLDLRGEVDVQGWEAQLSDPAPQDQGGDS